MSELYGALAKAQGEMSNAVKDAKNPHFRSQYATLAAVVDCVRGPLAKYGIAWVQRTTTDGKRVACETVLYHSSGDQLSCGAISAEAKDTSPQAIGSVLTYLRRYSLMAALGVPAEDDDGEAGQGRRAKISIEEPPEHPITASPEVVDAWLMSLDKPTIIHRDAGALDALRRAIDVGGPSRGAFDAFAVKYAAR